VPVVGLFAAVGAAATESAFKMRWLPSTSDPAVPLAVVFVPSRVAPFAPLISKLIAFELFAPLYILKYLLVSMYTSYENSAEPSDRVNVNAGGVVDVALPLFQFSVSAVPLYASLNPSVIASAVSLLAELTAVPTAIITLLFDVPGDFKNSRIGLLFPFPSMI
jgi:hypothetical protein